MEEKSLTKKAVRENPEAARESLLKAVSAFRRASEIMPLNPGFHDNRVKFNEQKTEDGAESLPKIKTSP